MLFFVYKELLQAYVADDFLCTQIAEKNKGDLSDYPKMMTIAIPLTQM